jgi:hypothetical protein
LYPSEFDYPMPALQRQITCQGLLKLVVLCDPFPQKWMGKP